MSLSLFPIILLQFTTSVPNHTDVSPFLVPHRFSVSVLFYRLSLSGCSLGQEATIFPLFGGDWIIYDAALPQLIKLIRILRLNVCVCLCIPDKGLGKVFKGGKWQITHSFADML